MGLKLYKIISRPPKVFSQFLMKSLTMTFYNKPLILGILFLHSKPPLSMASSGGAELTYFQLIQPPIHPEKLLCISFPTAKAPLKHGKSKLKWGWVGPQPTWQSLFWISLPKYQVQDKVRLLPSSAQAPAQLRLYWLYFQLIQSVASVGS